MSAALLAAWTVATAPFQGPDEADHFSYVQRLAETGRPPSPVDGDRPLSSEISAAIGFANLTQLRGDPDARPAWSAADERRWRELERELPPGAAEDGVGVNNMGKNPPLYYGLMAVPYHAGSAVGGFWARYALVRLTTALFVSVTVVLLWLLAAELFAATWVRTTVAGVAVLLPQLSFVGGAVSSDGLLTAVWTAFALVAVRLVRHGPTPSRLLSLTGLVAASLLTHGRGIAILPPLLVALALTARRHGLGRARGHRALLVGAALNLVLVGGYRLFLAPPSGAYGGEARLGDGFTLPALVSSTWQFYLPRLGFMDPRTGPEFGYRQVFVETFFGYFGTLDAPFGETTYDVLQWIVAAGLGALVALAVVRRREIAAHWPVAAMLAALVVSMLALLHIASYRALLTGDDPLITGRYLLPLVAVFAVAVGFVVSSLPRRVGVVAAGCVLGLGVSLQIGGLLVSLTRFYA